MITVDKAAEIARRHGLGLPDAQALTVLADDEEHANSLAARFAPDPLPDPPDALADKVSRRIRGY